MNKNIVTCIILSLVTCGIYAIYWYYCINDTACRTNPAIWNKGFLMLILLSIVTCGIYTLIWYYNMGKVFASATGTDNSVLYIVLSLFGLGLVSFALIQSQINQIYPTNN